MKKIKIKPSNANKTAVITPANVIFSRGEQEEKNNDHQLENAIYLPPQLISQRFMLERNSVDGKKPNSYVGARYKQPRSTSFYQVPIGGAIIHPDFIWIESVVWDNLIPQDASYKGSAGGGQSIYVEPKGPMKINYNGWKGLLRYGEAILIARVGDGVIKPSYLRINLPDKLSDFSSVFELDGWPNPFPSELFGYHQLILDLWELDPNGQQLPQEYQTSPPDTRNFSLVSTDWAWLGVWPGCRKYGGLAWSTLKSFSVVPNTVTLDASGTRINVNQKVTVKWQVDDAGLPKTQFGYPGSFRGIKLLLPDNSMVNSSLESGQIEIDLSSMPYQIGTGISIFANDPSGCGFDNNFIGIVGIKPNTQPSPLSPPEIAMLNSWMEPALPNSGEAFTAYFVCQNLGGEATGQFIARVELDNSVQSFNINIPSMNPGASQTIYWPFPSGLSVGTHWIYCYLDYNNAVSESNERDNIGYLGIVIS